MQSFSFSHIGVISSCFKEKFGIPRQPGLAPAATARLVLNEQFGEESVRDLQDFSHIWIIFVFHATLDQGWKPMVRPPRLGGNAKCGVFASRSMFRPNPLGMSVVKLDKIERSGSRITLFLSGCDLLDGAPVLDIKPYLPYVDSIPDAKGGFAAEKPETKCQVEFADKAIKQIQQASQATGQDITELIRQILQLDPRPAYQKDHNNKRIYSMKLYDFDLKWQYCENSKIKVLGID